jgi:hypothetical protein
MKISTLVIAAGLSLSAIASAQNVAPIDQGTVFGKLDRSCDATPADATPQSLLNEVPVDMTCQQIRIWTFPRRLASRKVLLPTLAVAGVTAGLILADRSVASDFRTTTAFGQFNRAFSGRNTEIGLIAMPLAFYGASLIRHDGYAQQTAIEAGEALLDAEILSLSLQHITQRPGPGGFSATGPGNEQWFSGQKGSFPSGHSAAAFAVASVFARRYHNHKWVPYVAYGAASAIALSRMSTLSHYSSDVFLGSALGFSIGQFAVGH